MSRGKRIQQIVLADKQQLFRRGLRTLLSSERDIQVLADASTLAETLQAAAMGCDLVVMAAALLDDASEAELFEIRRLQSTTAFLLLTQSDQCQPYEWPSENSAFDCLAKTSGSVELLAGIRRVAWGGSAERVSAVNSSADLKALAESGQGYARGAVLTAREQEIMRLLAEGRTVRETASELALSIKTVEAHKLNLMRKLNIHNRTALIEYALERGILPAAVPA